MPSFEVRVFMLFWFLYALNLCLIVRSMNPTEFVLPILMPLGQYPIILQSLEALFLYFLMFCKHLHVGRMASPYFCGSVIRFSGFICFDY